MNLPELIKELQKYNDGWPHQIRARVVYDGPDTREINFKEIEKVDSDEDGLYLIIEE